MTLSADKESILKLLLTAEIQGATRLLETLKQEYRQLSSRGVSELDNILSNKEQQLSDLAKADKQLIDFINTHAPGFNKTNIDKLWTTPPFQQFNQLWQVLKPLTQELQKQNEINGLLISQTKSHLTQAISILTGRDQNAEYDSKGLTDNNGYGRSLAKA